MKWSDAYLDQQRFNTDSEADDLVARLFSAGKSAELYAALGWSPAQLLQEEAHPVAQFVRKARAQADWLEPKRLMRSRAFFVKYGLEIMFLLGIVSLPFCYAATPGNKALYLSDKMRKQAAKRLMDTASFVMAVLSPGSWENGSALLAINKVRLIHAIARYYLSKQSAWDKQWGAPINQEDMAGTNLAFSYIILLGLERSGFTLSKTEKEDFLHTWRYIGYLLHIPEELLPGSLGEAYVLTEKIKTRCFAKTEEGQVLTQELIRFFQSQLPDWQGRLLPYQMQVFLGKEVSAYLGLAQHPIWTPVANAFTEFKNIQHSFFTKSESFPALLRQQAYIKGLPLSGNT
ncbi:oxygenase MpaB family protein [Cytophagales bacterium LB-30]|uniref:Oxygenase MpaB family protein n=1 Tax=Shiella aurantiaca TaxID=3058365 RepID=A0ABT8F0Y9_9BACT|nr:oxygenase MpaB family protein [Shiella aurantiaca]MDN4163953.1 oxygenase MpaB family protein [Shiella aurantiaca]